MQAAQPFRSRCHCEVSQLSQPAADDAYDATRSWLEADLNRRYDAFCHHPPVCPFTARLMTREYSSACREVSNPLLGAY